LVRSARGDRQSSRCRAFFAHADAKVALLVEGDIAHAKRLGLGDVGRAGIAAVARDLAWRLAVRRNVALQRSHGQKPLGVSQAAQLPRRQNISCLTQLSHQTKKYDLKSKHCGAQSDLGTTRAKVVEALTEARRAKINGPALIFDDQLCANCVPRTPTPAHQRRAGQCQMSSERAVSFSTTNRERP
jgi:hypothetical protein